MPTEQEKHFIERLNKHPQLRNRMESLLGVVENAAGDCDKADAAEQYVIEELRKMGNEALHCWGENAALKSESAQLEQQPLSHRDGKKRPAGKAPSGKSKS